MIICTLLMMICTSLSPASHQPSVLQVWLCFCCRKIRIWGRVYIRASRCCVYRAVILQVVVLPSSSLSWCVRKQQQSFHSWLEEFNRIRASGAGRERGCSLLWEKCSGNTSALLKLLMELLPDNSGLFGDNLAESGAALLISLLCCRRWALCRL